MATVVWCVGVREWSLFVCLCVCVSSTFSSYVLAFLWARSRAYPTQTQFASHNPKKEKTTGKIFPKIRAQIHMICEFSTHISIFFAWL